MAPQGTNLVLTADIPHSEGDVLVLDSFDVESYKRYPTVSVSQLVEDINRSATCIQPYKDGLLEQNKRRV